MMDPGRSLSRAVGCMLWVSAVALVLLLVCAFFLGRCSAGGVA